MGKPPDSAEFVRALAPALRQAASIARALEGRVANRPKQGEQSDVKAALTIADTAAQEAILVALYERFPHVSVEAEEATPSVSRFPREGDALVVVDPIDGTLRCYLEGRGPYAVMVGLAVRGRYEAALVALPREGLLLEAVRGGGARLWRDETGPEELRARATGGRVLVSADLPEPAAAVLRARGLEPSPASGGAIAVAPLLPGVRAGLRIPRSEPRNVSVRGRIGARIAAEAGALLRSRGEEAFPDDIRAPAPALLVAAEADDLALLEEARAAVD